MPRVNRIEEELRDLTTQLERAGQQIQRLTEELSAIWLEEAEREHPDKTIIVLDIGRLLNPPYITGKVEKATQFYIWIKEIDQDHTYKQAQKNIERIVKTSQWPKLLT